MRFMIFACVMALAACDAPTTTTTTMATSQAAPVQAAAPSSGDMLSLLNAARAAQGLSAVTPNARLAQSARGHAQAMITNDFFDHVAPNGSRFTDRAQASGYPCAIAENIAFGQRSEARVFEVWLNSSGHRRNMLDPRANEYGLGRVNNHWVLVMGRGC